MHRFCGERATDVPLYAEEQEIDKIQDLADRGLVCVWVRRDGYDRLQHISSHDEGMIYSVYNFWI